MHAAHLFCRRRVPHLDASGGKLKTDNNCLVKLTDTFIVKKREGARVHSSMMAGRPLTLPCWKCRLTVTSADWTACPGEPKLVITILADGCCSGQPTLELEHQPSRQQSHAPDHQFVSATCAAILAGKPAAAGKCTRPIDHASAVVTDHGFDQGSRLLCSARGRPAHLHCRP
jgi:hypothetical protein